MMITEATISATAASTRAPAPAIPRASAVIHETPASNIVCANPPMNPTTLTAMSRTMPAPSAIPSPHRVKNDVISGPF